MDQLEAQLTATLKQAVESKERPMFTIALIAGDVVILDALHKADLLNKVKIVYVDTYVSLRAVPSAHRGCHCHCCVSIALHRQE